MSSLFKNLSYSNLIKYSIYIVIIFFIFSKEIIVLNEEFLIILSFLAVFFGLQQALSGVIVEELEQRNLQIKKQFLTLYQNKENFQQIVINLLEKKVNLFDNLKNYQELLNKDLHEIVENRNLVYDQLINIYLNQILTSYILKYNLELKNVYLNTFKEVESALVK